MTAAEETETETATAASTYELLGGGECNPRLPQNLIQREINFGRFITLVSSAYPAAGPNSSRAEPVVLPVQFIDPDIVLTRRDPVRPPIPELQPYAAPAAEAAPETVAVHDVADLVARRRITIGEDTADVILSGPAISELMRGGSAIVPVQGSKRHTTVRLEAKAEKHSEPALEDDHEIHDIGAFLARPTVRNADGAEVPIALDASQVRELLAGRDIQAMHGERRLRLSPRPQTGERTTAAAYVGGEKTAAMRKVVATHSKGNKQIQPAPETAPPQLGFYVPYRQTWTLLGYSRGALLSSIALAPQEETTIELFTWDRNTRSLEQSSSSELEVNNESVDMTKDTRQVTGELIKDSNFHAEASIHADVDVKPIKVGGTVGGGGGGGVKDTAKTTTDNIHENTRKAALRVRASRQSKVSETREFGSEQRTTRKIKNANSCHTLNLDYFEVLVNYEMETKCLREEAQLVVMFPVPEVYQWNRTTLRRHEPVLRAALINRSYAGGFEAARLLAARDHAFKAVCDKCHCGDEGSGGENDEREELQDLREAAVAVFQVINTLAPFDWDFHIRWALQEAAPPDPSVPTNPSPDTDVNLHRLLFIKQIQNKAPGVWSGLLAISGANAQASAASISVAKLKLLHATLSASGAADAAIAGAIMLLDEPARQVLRQAIYGQGLEVYKNVQQGNLDAMKALAIIGLPDPVSQLITAIVVNVVGAAVQQGVTAAASQIGVASLEAKFGIILDDMGLMSALAAFEEAYTAWQAALSDVLKNADAAADALEALADSRNDEIRNAYPLSTVADAREREEALIMHLGDNQNYYSFAVYQSRLNGGGGKLPDLVKNSNGLISESPMGMADGLIAFPINIDLTPPTVDATVFQRLREWFDDEVRGNIEIDEAPEPSKVSLPTPGIDIITRLGECDSCEGFIADSREVDIRNRRALARQSEAEASRYEKRLEGNSPDLDDPAPQRNAPSLSIKLTQEPPP